MAKHLLLVDYENVPRIDLSVLDDRFRAIVFVGATQNPPRAAAHKDTAHRFKRVEFQKIAGTGRNALDFHIACHLGRVLETEKATICIVVSRDKGFDPLLLYLNGKGLSCRRVEGFEELGPAQVVETLVLERPTAPPEFVCDRCNHAKTIEHDGGRWCSHCGIFASPPDPRLQPPGRVGYRDPAGAAHETMRFRQVCGWCHQSVDMTGGIFDEGEWMCGGCIAGYVESSSDGEAEFADL